ncbi:MAG: hypothetical protein RXR20_02710 [Paraburkholderia sp.]|jgi:hypothetical protein|uniref:hypothetical protein n=1 Tax=Burkholderiaceae TaxID=119060 RepID=UPI0010F93ABB|nr:hypothetical protein [Burkholderia sp. 4M9327F10]
MPYQPPYFILKQSVVARAKKAVLLPMKRSRADLISLRCHAALEALRRGKGWFGAAEAMTRVLLLTGCLSDSGYGRLDKETMASAQRAIARVLDAGKRSGRWCLDDSTYRQFADVVNLHDSQLHVVPLLAYDAANGRLGRMFRALRSEQPVGCEAGARQA